jgi:endonuclease G, mitochondrial
MSKLFFPIIFTIALFASVASGQPTCYEQFAEGRSPIITNHKLTTKYRELCNSGYAVGHSGLTRTPLWSAEYLTREHLYQARGLRRFNDFRPDLRLPAAERAELSDYSRSGLDRGHMSPSGDFGDQQSQDESFLLSNMIPQNAENNRGSWEAVESAVRREVKKRGVLYVITGPLFQGDQLQALKGRVIIPTGIFKCLFDLSRAEAGCYTEANAPGTDYAVSSVAEVEQLTGINLFPAMPASVKNRAMRLPEPKLRGAR